MRFRSIWTYLGKWRKWRSYLLVVVLAYVLMLALGGLLAPFRANLENLVFDQYQRWRPRPYTFDQPVRIVDIDDESIRRIGRWPWPRRTMASLVDALAKANVAAIGFDVLFSEKDQPSEDEKACAQATAHSADQAARCEERADGDVAFAHAISGLPVVLGTFFTTTPSAANARLVPKGSFSFVGDSPNAILTHLNGALAPIPALTDAATGLGFLNWLPDNDRVVRTVPLLLDINGQIQPSLAMETLRVAQGASGFVVKSTDAYGASSGKSTTVDAIKVGDVVVPTQGGGDLRVWFASADPRRTLPAWKALEADADLSDLAGKLVFVGPSAVGLSDIIATPLDPSTPGVEAHAQLVEQILSGVTLERPDWAPGAELIAGAALSLALAALVPFLPIYWTAALGLAAVAALGYCQLERVHPARRPVRPGRSEPPGWFRLPGGGRAALRPEAPAGERDPLGVRPIRLACGRCAARRASGKPAAGRSAARSDGDVLRHPLVHDSLGGLHRRRAVDVSQRISVADDRHHPEGARHRRQIYGRCDHGLLERAARRSCPWAPRGACRARDARDAGQAQPRMEGARPKRPGAPFTRSNSASASTPANAASATWDPISGSTIRRSATRSTSPRASKARPSSSASTSSPAPRRATKRRSSPGSKSITSGSRTRRARSPSSPWRAEQAYAQSEEFQHLRSLHDDILKAYRARNFAAAKQMAADAAQLAPADIRRTLPLLSEALRGARPSTSCPRPGRR